MFVPAVSINRSATSPTDVGIDEIAERNVDQRYHDQLEDDAGKPPESPGRARRRKFERSGVWTLRAAWRRPGEGVP